MKDDPTFNAPFMKLKDLKVAARKKPRQETPRQAQPDPRPGPGAPTDETSLFTQAMDGVMPLPNDLVVPEPPDQSAVVRQVRDTMKRQDQEVVDTLRALVTGKSRFDITCTGEYLEGHVISLDPRVLRQLKSGEFTIQAHLDLHGLVKEVARTTLNNFVQNSHAMGFRSLLIIHGRGLKSDTGPVLKEGVVRWLTTGTLSHLVLAFCSARPCDGGTGAMYVLLKKRPVKSNWKRPL